MGKQPWHSKTMLTFIATSIFGVLALAGVDIGLSDQAAILDVVLSVAAIALRLVTKEPII